MSITACMQEEATVSRFIYSISLACMTVVCATQIVAADAPTIADEMEHLRDSLKPSFREMVLSGRASPEVSEGRGSHRGMFWVKRLNYHIEIQRHDKSALEKQMKTYGSQSVSGVKQVGSALAVLRHASDIHIKIVSKERNGGTNAPIHLDILLMEDWGELKKTYRPRVRQWQGVFSSKDGHTKLDIKRDLSRDVDKCYSATLSKGANVGTSEIKMVTPRFAILVVEFAPGKDYRLNRSTCISRQMAQIFGLKNAPSDKRSILHPLTKSTGLSALDVMALELGYKSQKHGSVHDLIKRNHGDIEAWDRYLDDVRIEDLKTWKLLEAQRESESQ